MEEVEEVRFVASNLGLSVKDWIGSGRSGRSTIVASNLGLSVKDWIGSGRSGRSMICCQQFGLECQRWEEVEEVEEMRFVASNLGLSVKHSKKWKKYDLLPAIWA